MPVIGIYFAALINFSVALDPPLVIPRVHAAASRVPMAIWVAFCPLSTESRKVRQPYKQATGIP